VAFLAYWDPDAFSGTVYGLECERRVGGCMGREGIKKCFYVAKSGIGEDGAE
jgi:hypothetical protein